MANYNQQLDRLFIQWENESGTRGKRLFHRDGLMQKGESLKSKSGYWGREKGHEDQLWHDAKKRVLFLTKDANNNPGEDIREWNGVRRYGTRITGNFFTNISLWLHALNSIQPNGKYPPFSEASKYAVWSSAFNDLPFAIVNVKKESGGSSVSNDQLLDYNCTDGGRNAKYLRRELDILNPNIIVCCGGSGTVARIAMNLVYGKNNFVKVNERVYFDKSRNCVLIDFYHPSARIDRQEMYETLMTAYSSFCKGKKRTLKATASIP